MSTANPNKRVKRVKREYMREPERKALIRGQLAQMSSEELMALHALAPLSEFAHAIRGALRLRDPNYRPDGGPFTPSGDYNLVLWQSHRAEREKES